MEVSAMLNDSPKMVHRSTKWEKVSGKGKVIVDGKEVMAELHWYQADGEVFEMKVKRYSE